MQRYTKMEMCIRDRKKPMNITLPEELTVGELALRLKEMCIRDRTGLGLCCIPS